MAHTLRLEAPLAHVREKYKWVQWTLELFEFPYIRVANAHKWRSYIVREELANGELRATLLEEHNLNDLPRRNKVL